jgi:hypothetical protein
MKKLLMILTVCLLAFSGCEKEEAFIPVSCFVCETIQNGEVITSFTVTGQFTTREIGDYKAGLQAQACALLKDPTIEVICELKNR